MMNSAVPVWTVTLIDGEISEQGTFLCGAHGWHEVGKT